MKETAAPKREKVFDTFELTQVEFESLRSQFATSKIQKMGLRRPPVCFNEYRFVA